MKKEVKKKGKKKWGRIISVLLYKLIGGKGFSS